MSRLSNSRNTCVRVLVYLIQYCISLPPCWYLSTGHFNAIQILLLFSIQLVWLFTAIASIHKKDKIELTSRCLLQLAAIVGIRFTSGDLGPPLTLLFWRSACDLGLAVRFLASNGFDLMVCQNETCHAGANDSSKCLANFNPRNRIISIYYADLL